MIINSLQNQTIKNLARLKDSSRERAEQGLFLIEGHREISLAMKAGAEIVNLYYSQSYTKKELAIDEEKIVEVSKKVFEKISFRENPDGFLAVAKIKKLKLADLKLKLSPLLIILESVEKPGNLGAVLRTVDAAGGDAVIINDPKTDIYNPNVIRASQGAVFTVPTALSSVDETIEFCKINKIKILATAPEAEKEYTKVDYGESCALIFGAEDKGLSRKWLDLADEKIKIKMRGLADSLNVSVSAAIILFEAIRQRKI